ncbi:MAG: crossover junction endodeoxyribonuclease RuvC [Thermoguttaceae bacterium]
MSIILGIDPGLNTTGYGVIDFSTRKVRLLEGGIVRSKSKEMATKVLEIYEGVREVISAFNPQSIAMEQLYSHYARPTTAILMGHARGAIALATAQHGVTLTSYSATQVKKVLTGNGRAGKDQIQRAIRLEFGLAECPDPPDVADALAIALCHAYLSKLPIKVP